MNISEVVEKVRSYSPSEYSDEEIADWCNEVSAMLLHEVVGITDTDEAETLCDSPYDSMYIDYAIAKICLYQRDLNMYNQHISLFNMKLNAYKCWKMSNYPHRAESMKNWW